MLVAVPGIPVTSKTSSLLSDAPEAPAEKNAVQPPPPLNPHEVLQTVEPCPMRPPSQRVTFAAVDQTLDMMAAAALGREKMKTSWLPVESSHESTRRVGAYGVVAPPPTQSSVDVFDCRASMPGPGSSVIAFAAPLVGAASPPMRTTPRRPVLAYIAAVYEVIAKSW